MNSELLFAHFNRICDAPDAMPEMRGFIRDLAVRGKLVDHDPNDEPASRLVERIVARKAEQAGRGKVRRMEPRAEASNVDLPYPLPNSWEPTRIGELLTVIRGASPRPKGDPKYFSEERTQFHWIQISDIRKHSKDRALLDTDEFLTGEGMAKSILLPKGTLIVTISATIGVPIFIGFEGGCIHDGFLAFPNFPASELSRDFFFVLFQTLQSYALKKARGMAQLNLNTEIVRDFPLGLPPLDEQRRIVARVDELMALCDRLEAAQRERDSRHHRLAASAHHHLVNGPDVQAPHSHANFFIGHLQRIAVRPNLVKHLRQTILRLAVRGQLIPQNSEDNSVMDFLRRVANHKRQQAQSELLRDIALYGLGRAEFVEPQSSSIGFDIPQSWKWVPFGQITISRDGERIPISRADRSLRAKVFDYYGASGIIDKIDGYLFDKPLLLIGEDGRNLVDRSTPVAFIARGKYWVNNHAHVLDGISESFLRFLALCINSIDLKPYLTGTAQPKMNQSKMNSIPVAIPPEAELRRIVAKVDKLMALCDQLEASLTTAQAEASRLLESVLYHSLNASALSEIFA